MSAFFALIIARLLDPFSLIVVFLVSLSSQSKWIIPIAAICGFITAEIILALLQSNRVWTYTLLPNIIASLIHAILCYWLVKKFKKKSTQ